MRRIILCSLLHLCEQGSGSSSPGRPWAASLCVVGEFRVGLYLHRTGGGWRAKLASTSLCLSPARTRMHEDHSFFFARRAVKRCVRFYILVVRQA